MPNSDSEREARATAAERLLALLVSAREAFDGADVEAEMGALEALAAIRAALTWANRLALRRYVAVYDPAGMARGGTRLH